MAARWLPVDQQALDNLAEAGESVRLSQDSQPIGRQDVSFDLPRGTRNQQYLAEGKFKVKPLSQLRSVHLGHSEITQEQFNPWLLARQPLSLPGPLSFHNAVAHACQRIRKKSTNRSMV